MEDWRPILPDGEIAKTISVKSQAEDWRPVLADGNIAKTVSIASQMSGVSESFNIGSSLLDVTHARASRVSRKRRTVKFPEEPNDLEGLMEEEVEGACPWRRGELIGSGTYGRVYKAQDLSTGRICAVKVAKVHNASSSISKKVLADVLKELKLIECLRHPNIVSCLGHWHSEGCYQICMEFMPCSLRSMLEQFGALEALALAKATQQLLQGLQYLHEYKPPVVHRDLKGANVLVDCDFCLKLADFGCAKHSAGTKSFALVGSPHWMAPEVFQRRDGHGRKADIWSLGCVVIEMATAANPWGCFNNVMDALKTIAFTNVQPPVPEALSACGRDFLLRCVERDPEKRPTAKELLQHELVNCLPVYREEGSHGVSSFSWATWMAAAAAAAAASLAAAAASMGGSRQ
eukprot:TRINITY_DN13785_c0_g1_i1.p1 TRINITY_DN13785_c0_g1~~TRINITY_DN13785_c0_g1_i1.p1  ORF type:complete len:404 (-),score=86.53 TRINITY_DN13785_c0_g1_i1:126-1337(-)